MQGKEMFHNIELKRIPAGGSKGPSAFVNGDKVPYFTYSLLEQHKDVVKAIFTTRLGGVSQGDLSSLNLSFTRGDDPANVRSNFDKVAQILGISVNQFVFSHQTHTTNIRLVTKEDMGKGIVKPLDYENIDGLITKDPGVCLSLFFADCVPLYFFDPKNKGIGLAHSGWKGTVGQISAKMIRLMELSFGTKAEDLLVVIGPSICPNCYEVSEDVAKEFASVYSLDMKCLSHFDSVTDDRSFILTSGKEEGKYQLNLWQAIKQTLLMNGVKEEHIQSPDICTCCNPRILFSHRASGGKRGNLGAFMMLSED